MREEQLHQDALRFYEPIQRLNQGVDARFYFDLAICYQALGRDEEVKKTMEALRLFKRGARDANFYIGLAKLYRSQGKEEDMESIIKQLRRMGKSDLVVAAGLPLPRDTTRPAQGQTAVADDDDDQSDREDDLYRNIRSRSTRARNNKKQEQNQIRTGLVRNLYDQLLALNDGLEKEEAEAIMDWTSLAEQLLDEFKGEKVFFPRERAVKFTGFERWERKVTVPLGDQIFGEDGEPDKDIPQHYCDIHFEEWLDVFLQLSLQYARQGQGQTCWEVMKVISTANVYLHEPERMQKKHNVALSKWECCYHRVIR